MNIKNNCLLQGCEDGMTLIADNPFISKKELVPFEKGIRIDYILFKVGESNTCCIWISSYSQQDDGVITWICKVFNPQSWFFFFFFLISQGSSKKDIYCDFMSTTKGSVPDHPFPYSDHEALTAELRLEIHTETEAESDRQSKNQDSAAGILTRHASLMPLGTPMSFDHFGPDWNISEITDELSWKFVQTIMVLRRWILLTFVIPWLFI